MATKSLLPSNLAHGAAAKFPRSQTGKDILSRRDEAERDGDSLQCCFVPRAIHTGTGIVDDDGVKIAVAEFTGRLCDAHVSYQSRDDDRVNPKPDEPEPNRV